MPRLIASGRPGRLSRGSAVHRDPAQRGFRFIALFFLSAPRCGRLLVTPDRSSQLRGWWRARRKSTLRARMNVWPGLSGSEDITEQAADLRRAMQSAERSCSRCGWPECDPHRRHDLDDDDRSLTRLLRPAGRSPCELARKGVSPTFSPTAVRSPSPGTKERVRVISSIFMSSRSMERLLRADSSILPDG